MRPLKDIEARPSPNFDARESAEVDILVLHYTGMRSAAEAIDRLTDPASKVSAHYFIDEEGTVLRLVDEDKRAWHAGVSSWRGARDINGRSIGIELVNPGHEFGYRLFPEAQMAALEGLAEDIVQRHRIPRDRVVGHSDVAPSRKQDPGELFDWPRLAARGIGLWPEHGFDAPGNAPAMAPGQKGAHVLDLQLALDGIGYGVEGTGLYDDLTRDVVSAFQRHWRPAGVDGVADSETVGRIHQVLALCQACQGD